ncbi:hypothetical protein DICA3_C15522 [Diutina catenulata]
MKLVAAAVLLLSIVYYYFYSTKSTSEPMSMAKFVANAKPFPTYFFSHGGPTFMYEDDDFGNKGAWKAVRKIGRTIKKWQPDYIIVVSAHWQSSGNNLIEVNVPSVPSAENELIYDFYGFPNHMYKEEFHSKNAPLIGEEIVNHLKQSGFNSKLTKRGIDHGVWVPFKVAFSDYNTQTKPQPAVKGLDLPDTAVIQVSLTARDNDFDAHIKLGQALNQFRLNNYWDESAQKHRRGLIVCSGMSVHNLHDLGRAMSMGGKAMPYVKPFNQLVKKVLETPRSSGSELIDRMLSIKADNATLLRQAHPTQEHFMPMVVAAGIASEGNQQAKELYNDELLSLGWGVYQFGDDYKE